MEDRKTVEHFAPVKKKKSGLPPHGLLGLCEKLSHMAIVKHQFKQ